MNSRRSISPRSSRENILDLQGESTPSHPHHFSGITPSFYMSSNSNNHENFSHPRIPVPPNISNTHTPSSIYLPTVQVHPSPITHTHSPYFINGPDRQIINSPPIARTPLGLDTGGNQMGQPNLSPNSRSPFNSIGSSGHLHTSPNIHSSNGLYSASIQIGASPSVPSFFNASPYHSNAGSYMTGSLPHPVTPYSPQFERLSIDDIEKQISKLDISIPTDFWKAPKPDDVHGLYSVALEEVLHIKMTDIRTEEITGNIMASFPGSDSVQMLSFEGRMHKHALGNLRYLRFCRHMCVNILGVNSFNKDFIFRPTPHTVLLFSTAFVHFLKFRDWIYTEHTDLFNELQHKFDEGQIQDEKINTLEADLNQFKTFLDERQSEIKERKLFFEQWREKLNTINFQHIELTNQLSSLQANLNSLNSKENDITVSLGKANIEKESIKDQIVLFPDKFIQSEKDIKKNVQTAINSIKEKEESIHLLNEKILMMEKLSKRLLSMENILTSQLEPSIHALYSEKSKLKQTRQQMQELDGMYRQHKKEADQIEESTIHLTKELKQRESNWKNHLQEVGNELTKLEDKNRQRKEAMKTEEESLERLKEKCNGISTYVVDLNNKHNEVLYSMETKFREMCECRDQFLSEIEKLKSTLHIGWTNCDRQKSQHQDEINNISLDTSEAVDPASEDFDESCCGTEEDVDYRLMYDAIEDSELAKQTNLNLYSNFSKSISNSLENPLIKTEKKSYFKENSNTGRKQSEGIENEYNISEINK